MALFSKDLFPTKLSFVVFILYMALFINAGILVTASKTKSNTYMYNTVTVVLLAECLKLVTAIVIYLKDKTVGEFVAEFVKNKDVLLYYFVPAGMYCAYNNLAFVNLATYDPTTYYLLLQFRVVVTGVVFQIVFKKKLSRIQWMSLLFLTVGCIVKEYSRFAKAETTETVTDNNSWPILAYLDPHLLLIFVQVFCSCFAGVYNEYLMKDKGCDIHLMMQNVFMYVDSIICNVALLGYKGDLLEAFTPASIASIWHVGIVAIMINNAGIGIVTSLFLKSMNSILKTFASALELMFTAILCWIIFGISIDLYTVIAIFIVSAATFLYAQNPVVNKAKNEIEVDPHKKNGEKKSVQSA